MDERKKGKNGDHKVIIMAPLCNTNFKLERKKRIVKTRPLPKENFERFRKEFILHKWKEVFEVNDVNQKTENFHNTLRVLLDKFFPEKSMKISQLDKKWMNPMLKSLHRKVQR